MKTILGLMLLATAALAYPLGDSEAPKQPEVPLVIADYSSVTKSEKAPVAPQVDVTAHVEPAIAPLANPEIQQDAHHSHALADQLQHDSSESSASSESDEKNSAEKVKPVEAKKPVLAKSSESSEESKQLNDATIPVTNLEDKKEVKELKPKPTEVKREVAKEADLKKEAEPVEKLEAAASTKSLLTGDKLADLIEAAHRPVGLAEDIALSPIPAPVGKESKSAEKSSESSESSESNEKSQEITVPAADKIEKPLALPTLESNDKPVTDLPVEVVKEDLVLPSEQKVEVSPAAEESVPQLKSTDKLPVPEVLQDPVPVPAEEKPLVVLPAKPEGLDDKKKAKSEGDEVVPAILEKSEDIAAPEVVKPAEPKLEDIAQVKIAKDVAEIKREIVPELKAKSEVLPQTPVQAETAVLLPEPTPAILLPSTDKKEDVSTLKPEILAEVKPDLKSVDPKPTTPKVDEPLGVAPLAVAPIEVIPAKLPAPVSASS